MNVLSLLLVLSGTIVSSAAQLLLKAGTNALSVSGSNSTWIIRVATQPFIWGGIACYVASMGIWILVLSRMPVSVAYPLLSIGYIITALFGYLLFGEQLGFVKIAGILIIMLGVAILTTAKA